MLIALQKILPETLAATLIKKKRANFDSLWKHAVT
jgi:hypothetical protein